VESLNFSNEIRLNINGIRKAILEAGSGDKNVLLKRGSFTVSSRSVQADVVHL
jgi:hypothetical protein